MKTEHTKYKTVGEASLDLQKQDVVDATYQELQTEMQKEYMHTLWKEIDEQKELFKEPFYLVVITKREKLMTNVMRNYFMSRQSCPTPDWDQAVYRYTKSEDKLEFLWVIPDRDICDWMLDHPGDVPLEHEHLMMFARQLYSGELLKLAKRLNNEQKDSNLLETNK